MGINKVIYRGETIFDISDVSVTPETLSLGTTAHDKTGSLITGTLDLGSSEGIITVHKYSNDPHDSFGNDGDIYILDNTGSGSM